MTFVRVLPFPGKGALPPIANGIEKSFEFRTITPVFGAGVKAGELDHYTPVRGTTVRGHLRFWWRVTRGRQFGTADQVRAAETAIWGSASEPSSVGIAVAGVVSVSESSGSQADFRDNYPPYALFPFKTTDEPPVFAQTWKTLKFDLLIHAPEAMQADVEMALWAWANFGGIGGRTRRGCGALFCADFAPTARPGATWIHDKLIGTPIAAGPPSWSRVVQEPVLGTEKGLLRAWHEAIELLAAFRQYPPVGRVGDRLSKRFGRSHWPEADSLRAQSRLGNPVHMSSETLPNAASLPAFPRAELGLPYQVKFKDDRDAANDCQVLPVGSDRIASPLVLRPLAIGPKGERAVPMILCLDSALPSVVRIRRDQKDVKFRIQPTVRAPALSLYGGSPMKDLSPEGSALESFLNFARGRLAES